MTQINALSWMDQSDVKAPLAPYVLDFNQDKTWAFPTLQSTYQNNPILPAGVVINNSQGTSTVSVTYGNYVATINPFTAAAVDFSNLNIGVTITSPGVAKVPIYFYVKKPSPDTLGVNYAGASSVASNTILQNVLAIINATGPLIGIFNCANAAPPPAAGGALITAQNFTPNSSVSTIEITIQVKGTVGANDGYMLALFDDLVYIDQVNFPIASAVGANAVFTMVTYVASPGAGVPMTLNLKVGSTGGNTFFLNETNNGGAAPNGWVSFMSIKEVVANQ